MYARPIAPALVAALAAASLACGRARHPASPVLPDGKLDLLVLGDSLSTGVFTHPDFQLDYAGIVSEATRGERLAVTAALLGDDAAGGALQKPVRVGDPVKEISSFGGGNEKAAAALLKVIEWPELSWSSQRAHAEHRDASRIAIAARNGAESTQAKDEVDTWLKAEHANHHQPVLPAEVVVFFSGDDLCRAEGAKDPPTRPEVYEQSLREAVRALIAGAAASPGGTMLTLVSHLDVGQLVASPELFQQKHVHLTDTTGAHDLSCAEFMQQHQTAKGKSPFTSSESALLSFTYHPMNFCQNLLAHTAGLDPARSKTSLADLSALVDGYRAGLAHLAAELAADPAVKAAGITVRHVTATEHLAVSPDELANDCFHLSAAGQKKLAEALSTP